MAKAHSLSPVREPLATCKVLPIETVRATSPAVSNRTDSVTPAQGDTSTMEPFPGPQTRAAIFSTENGRRLARQQPPGPPFPPVIVRSEKIEGVVAYANYWRVKYPLLYHNFFPRSGWIISDLWDSADIHLDSPGFLEEVLGFITRDNEFRAKREALEWHEANRDNHEKISMIAGDLNHIWDPHDPSTFFKMIFTDEDMEKYPPIYWWHVLSHLKTSMSIAARKAAADSQESDKAQGEPATTTKPEPPSTTTENSALTGKGKQPRAAPGPVTAPHMAQEVGSHFVPEISVGPSLYPPPPFIEVPPRGPSMASSRQMRRYPNMANTASFGQYVVPAYPDEPPRHPRHRASRSSSNTKSWGDLIPVPANQHHQRRQPSARMPSGPPPYFSPPVSVPGPMGHPTGFSQDHPSSAFSSPYLNPAHPRYTTTVQQGILPHHPSMHHVPAPVDPNYQQFGPGGPDQRGIVFGDMSNNPQYPLARGVESRGPMSRRASYGPKAPGLYNPYGAERPEKAGFATIPSRGSAGKARRDSTSKGNSRPLEHPSGFGPQSFDDREAQSHSSGNIGTLHHPRSNYSRVRLDIVQDMEGGCSQDRIGPQNTTVIDLFVKNLPENVIEDEICSFFQKQAKVAPTHVYLRPGAEYFSHAFVHFNSTADCRRALQLNGKSMRGKGVVVSVPYRYWMYPDTHKHRAEGQVSEYRTPSGQRVPSQEPRGGTEGALAPQKPIQYSPQDARSDLNRVGYRQPDQGSPQARKAKKHAAPYAKVSPTNKERPQDQTGTNTNDQHLTHDTQVHDQSIDPSLAIPVESIQVPELSANEPISPQTMPRLHESTPSTASVEVITQDVASHAPQTASPDISGSQQGTPNVIPLAAESELGQSDITSARDVKVIHTDSPSLAPLPETPVAKVSLPPVSSSSKSPGMEVTSHEGTTEKRIKKEARTAEGLEAGRAQEENASDDEQKNDFSFYSAKDSQSDTGVIERKGESNLNDKPGETSLGSVTGLFASEPTTAKPSTVEQADTKADEATTDAGKAGEQESKPHDLPVKPPHVAEKKQGAKQTQSLFPFAKPSKSQAKKDREAKKKDKKKEKGKGKAEKPIATTSTNIIAAGLPRSIASKVEAQTEIVVEGKMTVASEAPGDDSNLEAIPSKTDIVDVPEGVDNERGDGQAENKQQTQEALQLEPCHESLDASTSHQENLDATSQQQPEPDKTSEELPRDEANTVQKTKGSRQKPAIPNLNLLLNRKPSPNRASASDTAAGAKPPETRRNSTTTQFTIIEVGSEHSSSTIRPDSPPPTSLSSNATTFFTPAQTPSTMDPGSSMAGSLPPGPPGPPAPPTPPAPSAAPPTAPPVEAPKKKKNKKKKKTAAKLEEEQASSFHEQMSQIEGGTSYYSREDQEAAGKGPRSEDKDSRNLFQTVHDYVKEKVDTYARLPEKSWSLEDRRKPEKMTADVMAEMLPLEEPDIIKRFHADSEMDDEHRVKPREIGTKGLFHD